jgi:hypothetical protein
MIEFIRELAFYGISRIICSFFSLKKYSRYNVSLHIFLIKIYGKNAAIFQIIW